MHLEDHGKSGTTGEEMQLKKQKKVKYTTFITTRYCTSISNQNNQSLRNKYEKERFCDWPFSPLKIFSEPYIGVLFCSTTRKFMTIRLPFCVLFWGSCISDQTVKLGSADQIWIKVLLLYKYESRFSYYIVCGRCFQKRCVLFRYIMRTSGRQVENGCGGRGGLTCTNMHIDIH